MGLSDRYDGRMKSSVLIITTFVLLLAIILIGCNNPPAPVPVPAPTPIPGPSPSIEPSKDIDANHVHVNNGEDIVFSGTSMLPDGTDLQTQLYIGDEPLSWWPTEKIIRVQDGEWEITVLLVDNGEPRYLSTTTYYSFNVWEKDNPIVTAGIGFDMMGPPLPDR